MDLILWRHAEAVEAKSGQDDLERALSARGERHAKRMAEWLSRHLPDGTKVLVSPARRTQQTALALDRKFKTSSALAPDATVDTLLHAVRWPDAREPVLAIGHQPTLGFVAAYLLSGQAQSWTVRKAGLWWLRARERDGQLQVTLQGAMSPELL